nr:MAG TPA_asm: hypothetical protein [Caudoviricetes sp.]
MGWEAFGFGGYFVAEVGGGCGFYSCGFENLVDGEVDALSGFG